MPLITSIPVTKEEMQPERVSVRKVWSCSMLSTYSCGSDLQLWTQPFKVKSVPLLRLGHASVKHLNYAVQFILMESLRSVDSPMGEKEMLF